MNAHSAGSNLSEPVGRKQMESFESMFGPNTPLQPPKPPTRTRAPKGYETINGKAYKKAEGYYSNRCPGSLRKIPWYRIQRNQNLGTFICPSCGRLCEPKWQESVLGYWNYPAHDRPSSPEEIAEIESRPKLLPEEAPF